MAYFTDMPRQPSTFKALRGNLANFMANVAHDASWQVIFDCCCELDPGRQVRSISFLVRVSRQSGVHFVLGPRQVFVGTSEKGLETCSKVWQTFESFSEM
jgi:hypothetical protein